MEQSIFRPYRVSSAERSDRASGDRLRHRAKVRQSIRENIADIIAEESIIGKDHERIIKVPIRGIKEYRFIYGENLPGVGQGKGDGSTQPGNVVGKVKKKEKDDLRHVGDQPGEDYYETDVTLEELIEIMFEDLELPDLERKRLRKTPTKFSRKRKGYRRAGIRPRLDRYRTAIKRVRRKMGVIHARAVLEKKLETLIEEGRDDEKKRKIEAQMPAMYRRISGIQSGEDRFPFHDNDLTYRHMEPKTRNESNAVVLLMMDTSGSMDIMKKYLARSFFFLLYQFVKNKYQRVEVVFIAHHTEAREVTEEEFFHKGESGGTFISSAYAKALEVIADRYHPALWNIYAFHCSDGDNFPSDTPIALQRASELAELTNLFGYAEIKPLGAGHYESSMLREFRKVDMDTFQTVLIERKEDIFSMFKALLKKEKIKD